MLKLSENLKLPDAVITQHMAVLGKTRSGKSSVLRLFVEAMLDRKERVCIVDPKGDWWGIKSSADGMRPGYGVVIFGGNRADLPLNQHAGASVAELVASGNRPCVIDLGGWHVGERTRFFIDFASTLFRNNGSPLWLVIDEVHNFAPQGKIMDPDAGKMLHWANRLGSEGAGKGIVIMSASQRPQKVHKDFLTCSETLVAMRVIHNLDRKAIKEWIDGCPDASKGNEVLGSLASMSRGQGWVWSPEAGFGPELVKFPLFKTYDSFAAPTGNTSSAPLKGWAEVDLEDVKTKLAAVVEEAKANDPKELRRQIAELKKQKTAPAYDHTATQQAIAMAIAARDKHWEAAIKERDRMLGDFTGRLSKIGQLAHLNGEATPKVAPPAQVKTSVHKPVSRPVPEKRQDYARTDAASEVGTGGLRRIMTALAQRPQGLSARQLGIRAALSSKSGTFGTYLARARTAGWISGDKNRLTITDDGLAALGEYEPLPEGRELLEHWLRELGAGEARMLRAIADAYPDPISKQELGEAAGLSANSGTFGTYLSRIRSLELVVGTSGMIRASEELF